MPFVQRVVKPTYLSRMLPFHTNGDSSLAIEDKCKCKNNNCLKQCSNNVRKIEDITCVARVPIKKNVDNASATQNNLQTIALIHQSTPLPTSTSRIENEIDKSKDECKHLEHPLCQIQRDKKSTFIADNKFSTDVTFPMKKLKEHDEFYSGSTSTFTADTNASKVHLRQEIPNSPIHLKSTATKKIVAGYEFESISNITLSNALRQLASLVLITSDIFDELHQELNSIAERTSAAKRKISVVGQKVFAFDPKMVTVPESDLLIFAQRKSHYESKKFIRKELFTVETRPLSVKVLYEYAGRVSSERTEVSANIPNSFTREAQTANIDGVLDVSGTVLDNIHIKDVLVGTPVPVHQIMRTKIDTDIEIRLPAAVEDLRKWTSNEALGDITVTPDCMHHVDTSLNSCVIVSDNGLPSPTLSPSLISTDAVDGFYSINSSNATNNTEIPNDINKDVPLNHRLPSPEEQCKVIALRYPAEIISVDTSGKRFERMCTARKSTTGYIANVPDSNILNDDIQTVSRRSRSRKSRGKRRNTIAGIGQKEIHDATNSDSNFNINETKNILTGLEVEGAEQSKKISRSKSSDLLKKESVALPYDKGKITLTRLNSLKQWGRNRFKFMHRNETTSMSYDKSECSRDTLTVTINSSILPISAKHCDDMRDSCRIPKLIQHRSEGRFLHERKPSYSSSEKSVSISNGQLRGKLHLNACGNVKLRDTSSLNRQRRSGISGNCLGSKDDQPHSSSGNWSASSESGRTSIGSELTIQPKSSISTTSLNASCFHQNSGPPSSMMSRRRFLNTSATSSVTSDGTATPDLQMGDAYTNHIDDETSSAYSCDTEGYYTSFHMDSGLRTLKEEEPLHHNNQNTTNNYSLACQTNQIVLSADNEYEMFGRGSTSTTTSSAGTVCTALMVNEHNSLNSIGPDVPERISSLSKLNFSNHSNNTSSSTLERSYSSSTIGSTLERTATIKRNINNNLKLAEEVEEKTDDKKNFPSTDPPEPLEVKIDFDRHMRKNSTPELTIAAIGTEVECSESSDLESVERIERLKQKTAIHAKRIPSMCIITPNTSDDENQSNENDNDTDETRINSMTIENSESGLCKIDIEVAKREFPISPKLLSIEFPATVPVVKNLNDQNLNVLNSYNYSVNITNNLKDVTPNTTCNVEDDKLYDTAGEYVTISDISNNNQYHKLKQTKTTSFGNLGIYYSNDIIQCKLSNLNVPGNLQGSNDTLTTRDIEYISFNEMPYNLRRCDVKEYLGSTEKGKSVLSETLKMATSQGNKRRQSSVCANSEMSSNVDIYAEITEQPERVSVSSIPHQKGAPVQINAQGKIIYDSDSLKRSKGAHTTFTPGLFVKEIECSISKIQNREQVSKLIFTNGNASGTRKIANVRPIVSTSALTRRPINNTTRMLSPGSYESSTVSATYTDKTNQANLIPKSTLFSETAPMKYDVPSTLSTRLLELKTNSNVTQESLISPKKDEGDQHVHTKFQHCISANQAIAYKMANVNPFASSIPNYWTLQNRRPSSSRLDNDTSQDDLYAIPIRRSERASIIGTQVSTSKILPRNLSGSTGFYTSTPTKYDSQLALIPAKQPIVSSVNWDGNGSERLNTCADRIGQAKTSLMDFKKLLLAKSIKNSPVQKRVSAVELLKKSSSSSENISIIPKECSSSGLQSQPYDISILDSSMQLLDLSSSPKTFANRRMLRKGQFGSPSKSFSPKMKSSGARRGHTSLHRTDIISTTIPEANSEEDHSNPNSSTKSYFETTNVNRQKFDLKRNFFLQTEENNFMRGETKSFDKIKMTKTLGHGSTNQYVNGTISRIVAKSTSQVDTSNKNEELSVSFTGQFEVSKTNASARVNGTVTQGNKCHGTTNELPALETAL